MPPQTTQQGESGTESSRMTGTLSNTPHAETQPQDRHQLVQRDAANTATGNMTLDAPVKIFCKTGKSKNKEQHSIGCMCSCIEVYSRQLMI